jgi:hypothetical protein
MIAALTLVLAYRVPTIPSCPQVRSRSAVLSLTDQEERISQVMELPTAEKLSESARGSGLALALDDGTRKSHSVAENTAFVTGFFRGIATKQSFGQLGVTQGLEPQTSRPCPPPLRTAVGGRLAMRDLETRSATWIPQAGLLSRLSPALDSHDAVFRVRGDGVSLRREHRPLRPSARLPNAAPPPGARGGHGLLPWPAVAGERGALHRDEEVRRANSRGSDRCAVLACGAHVHAVPRRPLRRADDGGHGASVDGTRGGQGDGLLRVR